MPFRTYKVSNEDRDIHVRLGTSYGFYFLVCTYKNITGSVSKYMIEKNNGPFNTVFQYMIIPSFLYEVF